jgi:hypothetical protein
MATKSDFAPDEWDALGFAVEDTVMVVALSNGPKFFESMAEIGATAKFMAEQARTSRSTLVRDLAGHAGMHRDKEMTADPVRMEATALSRVAAALALVASAAPDEVDAFTEFVIGVACSAAEARNGVDDREANAIDKIKSALI